MKHKKGTKRTSKYANTISMNCAHEYLENVFDTTKFHMHFPCIHCKGWLNIRKANT